MKFRSDYATQVYSLLNDSADISIDIYGEVASVGADTPYITLHFPLTDGRRFHALKKDEASGAAVQGQVGIWDDSPSSSLLIKQKMDTVDDVLDHAEIDLGILTSIPNQSGLVREEDTGLWHGWLRYEVMVTS